MDLDLRRAEGACCCGAVAVTVRARDLTLRQGQEALRLYQFNTGTARHCFCSVCGIYTHHQCRSNPGEFGVNVACLGGISPFDFAEGPVADAG